MQKKFFKAYRYFREAGFLPAISAWLANHYCKNGTESLLSFYNERFCQKEAV